MKQWLQRSIYNYYYFTISLVQSTLYRLADPSMPQALHSISKYSNKTPYLIIQTSLELKFDIGFSIVSRLNRLASLFFANTCWSNFLISSRYSISSVWPIFGCIIMCLGCTLKSKRVKKEWVQWQQKTSWCTRYVQRRMSHHHGCNDILTLYHPSTVFSNRSSNSGNQR